MNIAAFTKTTTVVTMDNLFVEVAVRFETARGKKLKLNVPYAVLVLINHFREKKPYDRKEPFLYARKKRK